VIDRGAGRRARQAIPAPRAAPVLRLHQLGHERQAVRSPRCGLPRISPGAERPAAEPLPGRHRQPAHTAPASLRNHKAKLTRRSDITAAADDQRTGHRDGRPAARPADADTRVSNLPDGELRTNHRYGRCSCYAITVARLPIWKLGIDPHACEPARTPEPAASLFPSEAGLII
jgi:hypothetical protein